MRPRPPRPGFNPFGWPLALRAGLALAAVAVAVWLRLQILPILPLGGGPFLTFFPAVLLVAFFAGVWPGLAAAVLSVLAAWYFLLERFSIVKALTDADVLALALFALVLVVNLALVHAMHVALARGRQAEVVVAASEQRVRSVLDNLFFNAALLDLDGTVREVNAAPLRASGITREDVLGKPLWDAVWWSHDTAVQEHLRVAVRRAAAGELVRYDTRVTESADRQRTIDLQLSPMRDADGRVTAVVASAVDVTARIDAMAALEHSEEKFRALAENIPQLAWMSDPQGHLTWFNRRWFDYTGAPEDQMTGHGWRAVHHPEHADRVFAKFREHLASGQPWEDTFPLRRHDGEFRWFLSRAQPVRNAAGEVVRWFGTNTDVTDQLMAERALRESQAGLLAREAALRHADRQKDIFLATLAHELRNPLAPIRSASHIISLRPAADDQVRRAAGVIERQSAHLARLVEDLLDLSRISAGNLQLRLATLDLRRAVESAVETCQPQIEAARHDCTVHLPEQPLMVRGDETRLAQCVANLVHNAVKFTPGPGRITVDVITLRPGWAGVRISDNGLGIGADMLPRVFELFVQESHSGMAGNSGLGLGLALTRHLVELHGGHVQAHSDGPGKGAEFVLELPLVAAPSPEPAPERGAPVAEPPSHRPSILVVDDNADAAALLKELFDLEGYATLVALDGAAAIAMCQREQPEVVVLDIGLPDISGYDVARRLRADTSLRQPLLVALTGWGDEDAREQARAAGIDRHLTKPADFAQLVQAIQEHFAAA